MEEEGKDLITEKGKIFRLSTAHTSYQFRITDHGHPEHVYYGPAVLEQPLEGFLVKRTAVIGSSIVYDEEDELYCLDHMALEWSGNGRGDYRFSPIEARMPDGSFVQDFVYVSHEIRPGCAAMETLPGAYGDEQECETLALHLKDTCLAVYLDLYYTVFYETDVIARRAVIRNEEKEKLSLRRMASCMLDLPDRNFVLLTLDGGWSREAHVHSQPLKCGMSVNFSSTGASSNRHNPGFLLREERAGEDSGYVYGFNLVYSGNHMEAVELAADRLARVVLGISPHCFEWNLGQGESFETPEAVMTFSSRGMNGMSGQFHRFVNRHIVRGDFQGKERPVLFNNWEAHFFDFTSKKLLQLASMAKRLGAELFVLDDGWFGERDSDRAGLGDYTVNRRKLPQGIRGFADKIRGMGMDFGLWFEPEMVNEDSELYRAHPEYAVRIPGRRPVKGRHQLVLDLCNPQVRDYLVEQVGRVVDEAGVAYVKWDMNRHIAEGYSPCLSNQGEFYHRYILGLYEVLDRIFRSRPHILVESCSSGGNRFDLGMLCYSQQIWASDDTDPMERLRIQGGLSLFYPLSAMGAHVSMAPHQQTLRNTPLSTRFAVSAFGCLGYELDLKYLSPKEKEEIKEQITFYKKYRKLFQYGEFSRIPQDKDNKVSWQCVDSERQTAICGLFQTMAGALEGYDRLSVKGLKPEAGYLLRTREQNLYIKRFGGLMKHVLPVELNPEGVILRTANRHYTLKDCVEEYEMTGAALADGALLNNQFMGSYYNSSTRLLGDYGSNLYVVEEIKTVKEADEEGTD